MSLDHWRAALQYTNNVPLIAILLAVLAMLPSCASTFSHQSQDGHPADKVVVASKNSIAIESLLRRSLDGVAGVEKVASIIEETLDPTDRTARLLRSSDDELRLEDGYILNRRSVFSGPGVGFSFASEPCFKPSRAAQIVGAEAGPVIYDNDGADRGRIYRVIRNGVRMHVYTTPLTYQCVASIEIYALPKLANTSITRNEVTLENLLLWPLEGQDGMDKLEAGLHKVFDDMKPLPNQHFTSSGAGYLASGAVLSGASIGRLSSHFDMSLKQDVCISPEPYAELIDARASVILDAHGEDRGKTYSVERNGVRVEINTTPMTYGCITSIHIIRVLERDDDTVR